MPVDRPHIDRPSSASASVGEFVPAVLEAVDSQNDEIASLTGGLAATIEETEYTARKDPLAMAGACLFLASRICAEPYSREFITQTAAADAANCQGATIRKHTRRIPEVVVTEDPLAFDLAHLAELAALAVNERKRRDHTESD